MKQLSIIALLFFFTGGTTLFGQGHFLVEFDKFSLPVQDMIKGFEGHIAEPFFANDINGKEQSLSEYQGKKVLIWFWSIEDMTAQNQIGPLELLDQKHDDIKVIGFASESKSDVLKYVSKTDTKLTIIPNGDFFGEMAYGSEMGSPRMFLIDSQGIIRKVLPQESFGDNSQLMINLEKLFEKLN